MATKYPLSVDQATGDVYPLLVNGNPLNLPAGTLLDGTAIGGGSALVGKTLVVDSVNGNDSTATRGDAGKPYLTLTAAKTAALSGDTIHVGPGTYGENNLLKNGVNWYFEVGAKVIHTASVLPAAGIFDDSSRGANAAIVSTIGGHGHFETGTISATLIPGGVIYITNASSNVTVACDTITRHASPGGAYGYGVAQSAGTLIVNVRGNLSDNGGAAIWWSNGEMHVTANEIGTSAAPAFRAEDGGTPTGAVFVRAGKIVGTTTVYAITSVANSAARIWITAQHIIGPSGAIDCRGGFVYIEAEKIQSASDNNAINVGGGNLYVTAQKVENTSSAAMWAVGTCKAILTINEWASADGYPLVVMGDAATDVTLYNAELAKTTAGAPLAAGDGTIRLVNCCLKSITDSYPIDDGIDEFGVHLNATVKLQNCVLVSGSANSIRSTDFGGTIKVYNGCAANVAAGAGVTFSVGALSVDTDVN